MAINTVLEGTGKEVFVCRELPTVIIGERINPTGKKKLAASLIAGETCLIMNAAHLRPIVLASDLALGRDNYAMTFIKDYRRRSG